ncbi:TolC family protein [Zavarzinella formosa]|uniref:TolC family protein n=1 Tax=Zavarzinella formosa TaxID=360055 RepID=UPI0002D8F808|nr:TolC family protein [Zavarzinella formosa]
MGYHATPRAIGSFLRAVQPWRRWVFVSLLALTALGCTRKFYRDRADQDVEGLLDNRNDDDRWKLDQWRVYPDGRARYADFDRNPDQPGKPTDDPYTDSHAPNPQPIRSHFCTVPDREGGGYLEFIRSCDANNRAMREANGLPLPDVTPAGPNASSFDRALKTIEPPFVLTLDQAAELSLFNSREFQDRREDVYTAALPVTLQRFAFISQFYATEQAVRELSATNSPDGPGSRWTLNSNTGVSQLFPTGATLVAQLANRLVIDLSTKKPTIGFSNLALTLTQPLLRGGGWAVTLEPLTQAERDLVYGVRSYARFRKNYYVSIAGGGDILNAPYSYAGLSLRGVGPSLNAPSQGYLPTLLSSAQQNNERENIVTLTKYLDLFREYQGRGDVSELQIGQVEQQLLRGQSTYLARQQDVQNGLDSFKLQLGVPTRTPLALDDEPIRPMNDLLARFTDVRKDFAAVHDEIEQYPLRLRQPLLLFAGGLAATMPIEVRLRELLDNLSRSSPLVKGTKFRENFPPQWERWKKLTMNVIKDEIKTLGEELRDLELREAQVELRGEKLPPVEAARLAELPRNIAIGQLELALRNYEAGLGKRGPNTLRDSAVKYEEAVNYFILVISEARRERQQTVRKSWPKLPAVIVQNVNLLEDDLDRSQTVAAQMALGNRLELMNTRGQLVDAWRKIAVSANALLGVVNVGYNYQSTTNPGENQPLAISGSHSVHQLVISGELPLVRRAERNAYRTALIAYQRQRRNLQATEDFILNDVRTDLRSLRVLAENYRIQQRAVEVAFDQVENALDVLQAPPTPDNAGGQPGRAAAQTQQQAANAASLTQQLLNAQASLLQAQNSLYTIWVNYLVARMSFYRDIEQLPLDPRGVWIDEQPLPAVLPDPTSGGERPAVLPEPSPLGAGGSGPPARFAESR